MPEQISGLRKHNNHHQRVLIIPLEVFIIDSKHTTFLPLLAERQKMAAHCQGVQERGTQSGVDVEEKECSLRQSV